MSFANAAPAPFFASGATRSQPAEPFMNPRLLPIVIAVVCAHGMALWALQSGFLRPKVVLEPPPVVMLATLLDAPMPEAAPAPAPEPTPPAPPVVQPEPKRVVQPPPKRATPKPAPTPAPVIESAPAAPSETAISVPAAPVSTEPAAMAQTPAAPAAAPVVAPAPPAPPKVELPSSNASYLNNPQPTYPPMSRRLNEQGKVVVRVLIGADGNASQASIQSSSGYERLDQTAKATVLKWRFSPGKRGGVPEAMWFNVPLTFVLE